MQYDSYPGGTETVEQDNGFDDKYIFLFVIKLVHEGVNIRNSSANINMNSKSEFHQPAIPRANFTREIQETRTPVT